MGKQFQEIGPALAEWVREQHLFFVSTAPLSGEGLVNCSPKGMDTFRILGPRKVGYLDLTGSGVETIAHVRENGRIVVMFCAFDGPPRILRLHGTGSVHLPGSAPFDALVPLFPAASLPGVRSIVEVEAKRIAESCGFGVPLMSFVSHRDELPKWAELKGERLTDYRVRENTRSLDGLPGID